MNVVTIVPFLQEIEKENECFKNTFEVNIFKMRV